MSKNDEELKRSGFATAALVLGIIAVVLSFIPIINNGAFVIGVLAVIFGVIPLVKRRRVAISIIAIVLGILSVVITLSMQKSIGDALDKVDKDMTTSIDNSTGKNTDDILKNDVGVAIGKFTVTADEYGTQSSKLVVAVTNKTNEKQSFSIQIEAVDADGKRLTDDTVYANDLNAGQSQDLDAFTLIQDDRYKALKSATFNVVSVTKS